MANNKLVTQILLLNGTSGVWSELSGHVLGKGEPAVEFVPGVNSEENSSQLTSIKLKIGDGFTPFSNLPYVSSSEVFTILNGDGTEENPGLVAKVETLINDVATITGTDGLLDAIRKEIDDKFDALVIPTKVSDLTNDSKFQTDNEVETAISTALNNYYDKTTIDGKLSAIPKFAIEVVEELPTENISDTTVYLVPDNNEDTSDLYDEYIYINESWELLGKASLDLTGYATETYVTSITNPLAERVGTLETTVGDTINGLDTKISEAIDTAIGTKPTNTGTEDEPEYTGATGIYVDIYTKDEVTDLISSFTGGESAADVLAELNKYKTSNDARVKTIEDTLATHKVKDVKINGTSIVDKNGLADIPLATAEKLGVVKLGDEFQTNTETNALEVKELNVNKLVQTEGEYLILDGGNASDLIVVE